MLNLEPLCKLVSAQITIYEKHHEVKGCPSFYNFFCHRYLSVDARSFPIIIGLLFCFNVRAAKRFSYVFCETDEHNVASAKRSRN